MLDLRVGKLLYELVRLVREEREGGGNLGATSRDLETDDEGELLSLLPRLAPESILLLAYSLLRSVYQDPRDGPGSREAAIDAPPGFSQHDAE